MTEKIIHIQTPGGTVVRTNDPEASQQAVQNLVRQTPQGGILEKSEKEVEQTFEDSESAKLKIR